ncbi:MAG: type II toxin-antitoxin system VapC family toxin [Bacteroidetes bacterium]|nr:type II toxin-antitoxin system VapC family toxin [Bacteroidota bacterium]
MPGKLFLLDTNIIIALFAGDARVEKKIADAPGVFIPLIAIGELYYGAELSTQREQNIEKLNEFSRACQLLDCTLDTAKQYALLKSKLKRKGTPIPENDIWIAAIAAQYKLTLVSRDKHFKYIKKIKVVTW